MDLSPDILKAENDLLLLLQDNEISKADLQKLKMLQIYFTLGQQEVDVEQFKLVKFEDQQAIFNSSRQEAVRQYIFLINQQINPSGYIDIKTQTFGRWKTKEFKVDLNSKTFEILRTQKSKKKQKRIINLPQYSFEKMENSNNRMKFCLTALPNSNGYYKKLICGTNNEDFYIFLYEKIKRLAAVGDEFVMKKNKKSKSVLIGEDIKALNRQQSINFLQQSLKSNNGQNSFHEKVYSLSENKQRDKSDSLEQVSDVRSQFQVDVSVQKVTNQIISVAESKQPRILEQTMKLENQIEQFEENKIIHEEKKIIPELVKAPVENSMVKEIQFTDSDLTKIPIIFNFIIEQEKLDQKYFENSSRFFENVYTNDGIKIQKNTQNHLLYRCQIELPNRYNLEQVFITLTEAELIRRWNETTNHQSSFKLLGVYTTERSAIIYEKRKPASLFSLARDFVYLRHVLVKEGTLMILDKSIQHEDAPQYFGVVRGELNFQIIHIKKLKDYVLINIECEVANGGYASKQDDGYITEQYLKQLANLKWFLIANSPSQHIKSPLLNTLLQEQKLETQNNSCSFQDSERSPLEELPPIQENQNETIQLEEEKQQDSEILKEEEEDSIEEETKYESDIQILPPSSSKLTEDEKIKIQRVIQIVASNKHVSNCISQSSNYKIPERSKDAIVIGDIFLFRDDWKRDQKNGGLIFVNQSKIENQKKVVTFMLKKIGSNLLTGRNVMQISLPLYIFDKRSNLETTARSFSYAPIFLEDGAKLSSPLEQLKQSIIFSFSQVVLYIELEKPFNPIIGETFQGFIDGCPVFLEQISHHPPVNAFQLEGRGYKLDGHFEQHAQMHANSFSGTNKGFLRVTYDNTQAKHILLQCSGSFSGITFGERIFTLQGKFMIIDLDNLMICEINMSPAKALFQRREQPIDYFEGGIYRIREQTVKKLRQMGYAKFQGVDISKEASEKVGIWNQYFQFDDQKVFESNMWPFELKHHPFPLPSNSNFRADLLHWRLNDFNKGQEEKESMEIFQRKDRKLREIFKKMSK